LQPDTTPRFDLLFLDTAPWYRHVQGEGSLPEECRLWLSKVRSHNDVFELLAKWQMTTRALQTAGYAPFWHPQFVGLHSPTQWRPIVRQTLMANHTESIPSRSLALHPEYAEAITSSWDEQSRELGVAQSEPAPGTPPFATALARCGFRFWSCGSEGFSQAALKDLNADPAAFGNYLKQLEEVRFPLLMDGLQGLPVEAGLLDDQLSMADLELCHWAMHTRVREQFQAELSDNAQKWSVLLGVPIAPLPSTAPPPTDEYGVPLGYRGGFWLYASSSRDWTPEHEQCLLDLARMAWLLYNGEYNNKAAESLRGLERLKADHELAQYARGASHGLKNALIVPDLLLGGGARPGADWPSKCAAWLDHSTGLLGLSAQEDFRALVDRAARVRREMKYLKEQSQLFFWVMSPDRAASDAERDLANQRSSLLRLLGASVLRGTLLTVERLVDSELTHVLRDGGRVEITREELVDQILRLQEKWGNTEDHYLDTTELIAELDSWLCIKWETEGLELCGTAPPLRGVLVTVVDAVILELCQNAVKACIIAAGEQIRIPPRVSFHATRAEGNGLELRVANSATGASVERLDLGWGQIGGAHQTPSGIRGLWQLQLLCRDVVPGQLTLERGESGAQSAEMILRLNAVHGTHDTEVST
jgi:hypothetical protein